MARASLGFGACVLALAVAVPIAVAAQVPPELFGGGDPSTSGLDTKPFYESEDGTWLRMKTAGDIGLNCGVSYVTESSDGTLGDVFGIVGPASAIMAEKGMGMVVFSGPRIPKVLNNEGEVKVTILSDDPPAPATVMHSNNGEHNMFVVPVHVEEMIDATNPTESIGIQYKGKEVFRTNVVEYNNARKILRDCMAKYKGKRGRSR